MKDETRNRDRRIVPIQPQNDPSRLGPEPQGTVTNISPPDNRPLRVRALAAIDLIKNGAVFDDAIDKNHISAADFLEAVQSDSNLETAFIHAKDISHRILAERAVAVFQRTINPPEGSSVATSDALRASSAILAPDGPLANDPNSEPLVPPALAELARALAEKKGNLTDASNH